MAGTVEQQEPTTAVKKRLASPERRPGGDEDPDLECGICTELLNDARQAPCCGALACRQCLDHAAARTDLCPFCREALTVGAGLRDVRMERRAANTVRGCPHDGCDFRGKRDAVRAHVEDCVLRPLQQVVAQLRNELAEEQESKRQRVAVLTAERDAAKAEAKRYLKFALDAAYNAADESNDAVVLRTVRGYRHALRFKWDEAREKTWTSAPFAHDEHGEVKLEIVKGNCGLSLRLPRTSEDGQGWQQPLLLVRPANIDASERVVVFVNEETGWYHPHRLAESFTEFEHKFVKNGFFVVVVP